MDGKREGFGIYEFEDGSIYTGQWKKDVMDGYGKYSWPDGAIYEGEFKDNKRSGKGKLVYGQTSQINIEYEGEFMNDQRSGFGKLITTKGVYEGYFKEGNFDGEGKFTFKNDTVKEGVWLNGKLIKDQNKFSN